MNPQLRQALMTIVRMTVTGFLFTLGGVLCLALTNRFLHLGLCP